MRWQRAAWKLRLNQHMKNAVIYARYSSDRQRETSIDDQIRVCREQARTLEVPISRIYSDEGVSGTTPVSLRRDGARLIADALAGRFDLLIVEGLDRLSRDQVEQERTVRRLEHQGIQIIGASDGYDSSAAGKKIHRTMRGLINEIYLDDLRHKTHRGLAGQLARGGHAGGMSYGYRSVVDGDLHRLEIVDEEAARVRWMFEQYADGWSCQRIAAELNTQGVASSRGGTWAVSAIYGNPVKGSGVLNNELYVGRVIWNRSQWVKDPDSGKRIRLDRPMEEWQIEERPDLRIVSDALWAAVRERMGRPTRQGGSSGQGKAPRTLFGGLLKCGFCGGAVVATSGRHYGCATRKDRGAVVCPGVTAHRVKVDSRLLALIREELMSPEALAELQECVQEILGNIRSTMATEERTLRNRLAEIQADIGRLVDAIASIGISPALQTRLQQAESEAAQVKARIETGEKEVAGHLVDAIQRYRLLVADLERSLGTDVARARELIRRMIGPAQMVARDGQVWVEMPTGQSAAAVGLSAVLVAGARFGSKRTVLVS